MDQALSIRAQQLNNQYPDISGNMLNINTPLLVETFSENQIRNCTQTEENFSIDKNIKTSLLVTAPQIHPQTCTPFLKTQIKIQQDRFAPKIMAQLSALKSYVSCEISSLHSKIESIQQSLQVRYFRKEKPKLMKFFIRT